MPISSFQLLYTVLFKLSPVLFGLQSSLPTQSSYVCVNSPRIRKNVLVFSWWSPSGQQSKELSLLGGWLVEDPVAVCCVEGTRAQVVGLGVSWRRGLVFADLRCSPMPPLYRWVCTRHRREYQFVLSALGLKRACKFIKAFGERGGHLHVTECQHT